jgi:hypothetical protein
VCGLLGVESMNGGVCALAGEVLMVTQVVGCQFNCVWRRAGAPGGGCTVMSDFWERHREIASFDGESNNCRQQCIRLTDIPFGIGDLA